MHEKINECFQKFLYEILLKLAVQYYYFLLMFEITLEMFFFFVIISQYSVLYLIRHEAMRLEILKVNLPYWK